MDNLEEDRKDINDWFLIQSKKVQNQSQIVSCAGAGAMYHIDKKTPHVFTPQMPRSAAKSEDNTTSRITVAPNLMGCLIGYARSDFDFTDGTHPKVSKQTGFRGGYQICELPYMHCIQPTNRLVYDADRSLEHWLVSYNEKSLQYKPIDIGKMFVSSILLSAHDGNDPTSLITIYIEHNKTEGVKFSPTNTLDPGFHKAEVFFSDNADTRDCNKESDFKVKSCSASEYNEAKNLAATLLSYKDKPIPGYFKW